jgi:hypothetical protein
MQDFRFFIFAMGVIDCGLSQPIDVKPPLPEAAQNNGLERVDIEWKYPYEYSVTKYDFLIIPPEGGSIATQSFPIDDASSGQHSPLEGSYVWDVPNTAIAGDYRAELQISTKEAGGAVHDTVWRKFRIASVVGTL